MARVSDNSKSVIDETDLKKTRDEVQNHGNISNYQKPQIFLMPQYNHEVEKEETRKEKVMKILIEEMNISQIDIATLRSKFGDQIFLSVEKYFEYKEIHEQKGEGISPDREILAPARYIRSGDENKCKGDRWDHCILKTNIDPKDIHDLLKNKQYPNKRQLRQLCLKVGRKNELIKLVCTSICTRISESIRETYPTSSSDNVVWPAYEPKDENEIIFVANIDKNDDVTNKIDFGETNFTILCRNLKFPNKENRYVVKYELDNNIDIDLEMLDEMETDINCNFESLRKRHSNITMITASPVKSKGYRPDENKSEITQQNCIVIFVPAKGIIPLQEDRFPEKVGRFITDVREVYCKPLVGGPPDERHADLKMGCAIGTLTSSDLGTLGGFLKHPKHGLCALTCAHVVLTDIEIRNPLHFTKSTCVQPNTKNASDAFGVVEKDMYVFKSGSDKSSGVDAAIIKINTDEPRLPIDGHFPDYPADDLNGKL